MKNKSKKSNKINKAKIIKISIISVIVLIFIVMCFLVYKNLFSSNENTRYDGIENYEVTKKEKNSVKEKIKEIENVEDIDIYVNSKIIKIYIVLSDDTDFDNIKKITNESLSEFSDENLSFYDVEVFIESKNEESEIYPQIGYKHKTNSKFSW